jgi:GAF domain-containing protein
MLPEMRNMANGMGVGVGARQAAGPLAGALRSMAVISGTDGAALMLAAEPSGLRAVGGSSPEGLNLQYAQQSVQAGPALDAVSTDRPVAVVDLDGHHDRPGYARLALTAAPVRAVLAVPVHVRGDVVGALNFYRCTPCTWTKRQIVVGEHLADTAADLLVRLAARPAAGDGAHGRP